MKKKKSNAGRPDKPINWKAVDEFLKYQATEKEIAAALEVDVATLFRRCIKEKGMNYAKYSKEKKGLGKLKLRQLQVKSAEEGNVTMQIWLGKQNLGQQDRPEVQLIADRDIIIKFANGKQEKKI